MTDTKFSLPMPAQIDRLTVTRVEYTAGAGVHDDPFRRIIELHDGDGCFLRWDPVSGTASVSHIPTELSQAESGKGTA